MAGNNKKNDFDAHSPVEHLDTRSKHREPEEGVALCLSGGGYRAMLFHLGALWKLNEFGFLNKLARISSVSGGSITAAVLGMNWSRLEFDSNGVAGNFLSQVVNPVRNLAGKTIDRKAIFSGILLPGSISDKVTNAYRKYLFGDKTLQDLPDDPPPALLSMPPMCNQEHCGALLEGWRSQKTKSSISGCSSGIVSISTCSISR